jgi:hypothetical protein
MVRMAVSVIVPTACVLLLSCFLGQWDSDFRAFLAINAVVGAIIGTSVSLLRLPPVISGICLGCVGVCLGEVIFGSREGGWTVLIWLFAGIWGAGVGCLTGIAIRITRPREHPLNR